MEINLPKINIIITEDSVRVSSINILDRKNMKGIANIWVGPIKISGFKIFENKNTEEEKDNLFIMPPSYRSATDFCDSFYTKHKDLWDLIEERILQRYQELIEKDKPKTQNNIENNEIPIIEENPK